jgi:hypothetical protein
MNNLIKKILIEIKHFDLDIKSIQYGGNINNILINLSKKIKNIANDKIKRDLMILACIYYKLLLIKNTHIPNQIKNIQLIIIDLFTTYGLLLNNPISDNISSDKQNMSYSTVKSVVSSNIADKKLLKNKQNIIESTLISTVEDVANLLSSDQLYSQAEQTMKTAVEQAIKATEIAVSKIAISDTAISDSVKTVITVSDIATVTDETYIDAKEMLNKIKTAEDRANIAENKNKDLEQAHVQLKEAKQTADEAKRVQTEAKRTAEAKQTTDEAQRVQAEAKREAKKAEAKRVQAKKAEEIEAKKAEAKRVQAEQQVAEAKRTTDEAKREVEQKAQAQAEAQQQAEVQAEQVAEAKRTADEEAIQAQQKEAKRITYEAETKQIEAKRTTDEAKRIKKDEAKKAKAIKDAKQAKAAEDARDKDYNNRILIFNNKIADAQLIITNNQHNVNSNSKARDDTKEANAQILRYNAEKVALRNRFYPHQL